MEPERKDEAPSIDTSVFGPIQRVEEGWYNDAIAMGEHFLSKPKKPTAELSPAIEGSLREVRIASGIVMLVG